MDLIAIGAVAAAVWIAWRTVAGDDSPGGGAPVDVPPELAYLTITAQPYDNIPPRDLWGNIRTLDRLVGSLRQRFGELRVTSGYRSPAVNEAVGGAANSLHLQGLAVDFLPLDLRAAEVYADLFSRRDQLAEVLAEVILYERDGQGQRLHVGLGEGARFFRKQIETA